jgi:surfeit locus 1 family protein
MVIKSRLGAIVAVALAGTAFALCAWQLGRAAEKQAMIDLRTDRAQVVTLSRHSNQTADAPALDQQRVRLTGRWLLDRSVFLDNRGWEGQAGVHVLTPLALADDSVVWVNRGWLARQPGVAAAPEVPVAPPPQDLEGVALASVMRRMELSKDPEALRQGAVWQNFDWESARARMPAETWPVIVWQTSENGDGLRRKVPEVTDDVPKHLGYALQWFLMGLVALFFAWRLRPLSAQHALTKEKTLT